LCSFSQASCSASFILPIICCASFAVLPTISFSARAGFAAAGRPMVCGSR
jgi:hypothetical protein